MRIVALSDTHGPMPQTDTDLIDWMEQHGWFATHVTDVSEPYWCVRPLRARGSKLGPEIHRPTLRAAIVACMGL